MTLFPADTLSHQRCASAVLLPVHCAGGHLTRHALLEEVALCSEPLLQPQKTSVESWLAL